MALFGKKPQVAQPSDTDAMPIVPGSLSGRIDLMRAQGYSDNQIITMLQNEGIDVNQIYEAISQQNMSTGAPSDEPMAGFAPQEDYGSGYPPAGGFGVQQGQPVVSPMGPPSGPPASGPAGGINQDEREKIEEMAETIIDEKWHELLKTISKINEWKDGTETRITKVEQQMKDLKANFENLHTAIIGKIGEYDQNIINVGTEIKAMEKVFQKILPTFSENVNELSRIVTKFNK